MYLAQKEHYITINVNIVDDKSFFYIGQMATVISDLL